MNRLKTLGMLGALGLLFGTAASAQQIYNCALTSAPKTTPVSQDVEEIQNSCDGLMVEQDSTRIKLEAWNQCCRSADSYVRKEPIPPKGAEGDTAMLNRWSAYRVRLALAVCDAITDPDLKYQSNLCLTDMLFRIPDPRVTAILNECSPVGHGVKKGGGGHHHGADPAPNAHAQTVSGQAPNQKAAPEAPDNPLGATNSTDLLLNDEAFVQCQHEKLKKFIERMTREQDEDDSSDKKRM